MIDLEKLTFLTDAQIKEQAPAIFSEKASSEVSKHYTHIPTTKVIDDMRTLGWDVVDVQEVQRMEGRLSSRDVAFDLPRDADDDDSWQAPQYYLEDHSADPSLVVESSDWQQNSEAQLHAALGDLDERSRDILAQRWLAEDKATLHELAAQYSVSAERIRQLEQNAMKKLRASISA